MAYSVEGLIPEDIAAFRSDFDFYVIENKRRLVRSALETTSAAPEGMDYTRVSYLMSEARQFIEVMPDKKKEPFRWLRLYCHLCVHVKLDNDKVLYDLLEDIADAIAKAMNTGGEAVNDAFYRVIPNVLAPDHLRSELQALYEECEIKGDWWTQDELWTSFVRSLTSIIAWKRIGLPTAIVWAELERMGGLVEKSPSFEEPTERKGTLARRAKSYFRRMATIVGFPAAVPISLQLVPTQYMYSQMAQGRTQEELMAIRAKVEKSYPGELSWLVEGADKVMFVPFSPSGEVPHLSIGEHVVVVIARRRNA